MNKYKPRPKCCICGQYIQPGEERMWTHNKSTYFHAECYRKEVKADAGEETDAQEDICDNRSSEEAAEYPF